MAFAISGYKRLMTDGGGRTNKCFYKTADLLSVVMGTGYFNNVAPDHFEEGDIIDCAIDTDGNMHMITLLVADITSGVVNVVGTAQVFLADGAVTLGVKSVELKHATVAIDVTIANTLAHPGLFVAKATLEPGAGQDHVVTLTAGTFDGSNNVATFADILDTLVVWFDSAGNGTIVENVGSVALS